MEHGVGRSSPLSIVLKITALLAEAPTRPAFWNKTLGAAQRADPFFNDARTSVCHLDLEGRFREVLGSVGPEPHDLGLQELRVPRLKERVAQLQSRLRFGKPILLFDSQKPASGAAGLLVELLPLPFLEGSVMVFPLVDHVGINGALWIEGYDPAKCSREKVQMFETLGNCLSLALRASTNRDKQEDRDSILRKALEEQERERECLVQGVQDGVTKLLAEALQYVQAARDGRSSEVHQTACAPLRASSLLEEAMSELNGLRERLRPGALDRLGLVASIQSELEDLRRGGWSVELVADPIRLTKSRETSLYHIVHEALTNVKKHAGACRVRVTLKRRGDWLTLEVWDQGRGFTPVATPQPGDRHGIGLLSMRKRAELTGGRFEVRSKPGEGSTVTVRIPVRRKGD